MRALTKVLAVTAVAGLALTGCGRSDSGSTGDSTSGSAAASGFDKDAVIGISLPQKTSENWVLAEKLFNDGLTSAGFKGDVQFANGGVSEQQNQIQAMVTKGAKVIVVGAIDGSQLGTQLKAAKESGATIIAYDRLIKNTADVDYYVAYDNFDEKWHWEAAGRRLDGVELEVGKMGECRTLEEGKRLVEDALRPLWAKDRYPYDDVEPVSPAAPSKPSAPSPSAIEKP